MDVSCQEQTDQLLQLTWVKNQQPANTGMMIKDLAFISSLHPDLPKSS
jgi:hypothetical protein